MLLSLMLVKIKDHLGSIIHVSFFLESEHFCRCLLVSFHGSLVYKLHISSYMVWSIWL